MKLTIDMDEQYGYDDQSVAEMVRLAIKSEIDRYVKSLAKSVLATQEKELRRMVDKAATRDWKKVAAALAALQDSGER